MGFKEFKRIIPPDVNHDLYGWDEACLKLNRELLEETIDEAHVRENAIYARVGSLLALDGVILAIIFTFMSRSSVEPDSIFSYFIVAGILALIFSLVEKCDCKGILLENVKSLR